MSARNDFQHYGAIHDEIETAVLRALAKDDLVALEADFFRQSREPFQILRFEAFQYALTLRISNEFLNANHSPPRFVSSWTSVTRMAATSWVRSMPTGHHAIHRPQPTQPLLPNWSCQYDNLCMSHCR